jgi:hypothetical protein
MCEDESFGYTASALFSELHGQSGEKLLAAPFRGSFLAGYFRPSHGRRSFAVLSLYGSGFVNYRQSTTLALAGCPIWTDHFERHFKKANTTYAKRQRTSTFFQTMRFVHLPDNQIVRRGDKSESGGSPRLSLNRHRRVRRVKDCYRVVCKQDS